VYDPEFWLSKSRDARRDLLLLGCPTTGLWLRLSAATRLAVRVALVLDEGALVSVAAAMVAPSSAISGFSIPERQLAATVDSFPRSMAFFLGVAATVFSMDFWCHSKN